MASKAISAILNLKDNFSSSLKNISNNTGSFKKDLKDTGTEISEKDLKILEMPLKP